MHRDPVRQTRKIRRRVGSLDEAHLRVAPYAHQARLVLKNDADLQQFAALCQKAEIQPPVSLREGALDVQRLQIFSSANLRKVDIWLANLDWIVAFQCEALLRNLRLNTLELLELQPQINEVARQGSRYASQVLRHYHTVLRSLRKDETYLKAFTRTVEEYDEVYNGHKAGLDRGYFIAHHVNFTPTAMRLEGPYLHQSNRVVSILHCACILLLNNLLL